MKIIDCHTFRRQAGMPDPVPASILEELKSASPDNEYIVVTYHDANGNYADGVTVSCDDGYTDIEVINVLLASLGETADKGYVGGDLLICRGTGNELAFDPTLTVHRIRFTL